MRELCETLSLEISRGSGIDWESLRRKSPLRDYRTLLGRLQLLDNHSERREATPTLQARTRFAVGDKLAHRYRIDAFLDRGGMGEVYRATDELLDVPIALKVIGARIASNPDALRRFKREALLARSITHRHVCRIYDIGWDDDRDVAYLTMEFLPGRTLRDRLRNDGLLAPDTALPLIRQLAVGLDAAHRAGVIHRDFKSANIMLVPDGGRERAVIMDFGLAVETGDDSVDVGVVAGTPGYMSPEQVTKGRLSPASDLYALGVVLFEMMTGRLPFEASTPLALVLAHVHADPPSPREFTDLSSTWDQTILRLLAKEPADRYPSAVEVAAVLEGDAVRVELPPHTLPADRDAFVGRSSELALLASHLEGLDERRRARLVTIQGPGGTGKTRLAQEYGRRSLANWPGGVWFCDLADVGTRDEIAREVAIGLEIPLVKGDIIDQLGHAIDARGACLLILDNFEHVVDHVEATLGTWLKATADASFLVTSQSRLQLPEEATVQLETMDPATEGSELFETRAQAHRPGFVVDATNRSQVEGIVRRLDGIPLAIELATSRLRALGLDQLDDRLRERFTILAGRGKGRRRALRATLDWSWELLTPHEQSAMTQLSVFEGGFTLEAAEAVLDLSDDEDTPIILDVIQSLLDKSWLRADAALGAPRFDMYATMQEYASARQPADVGARARDRHGRHFAQLGTREAIDALDLTGGTTRQRALRADLENLVIACRRATEQAQEETAISTYAASATVLRARGPIPLSLELGEGVLAIAEEFGRGRVLFELAETESMLGMTREAGAHYESALDTHREANNRRDVGLVLSTMGDVLKRNGQMDEARDTCEAALRIHREVGDRNAEADTLRNLGNLHTQQGRHDEARSHYERAMSIHRDVGHLEGEAIDSGKLGFLNMLEGRMSEARDCYTFALTIHREMENRVEEGAVLRNLGNLHRGLGETDEAREWLTAALSVEREVGFRVGEAAVLSSLGLLDAQNGRFRDARRQFEAALTIHGETGDRSAEGNTLGHLGSVSLREGRLEEARKYLEAALDNHRELGNRYQEATVLGNLAILCGDEDLWEESRSHLEAALSIHRELDNRRFEGIALGNLGTLHERQGRAVEAREHYEAALPILREVGDRRSEGIALGDLATLHVAGGRMSEARRCFDEGIAIFRSIKNDTELAVILCGLGEFELALGDLVAARTVLAEIEAIEESAHVSSDAELARKMNALRDAVARADS